MFKRILTFASLFLVLPVMFSYSWAAEESLLNANFERMRGKSIPYEVEFLAKEGVGTLLLNNGDGDGNYCISSATVYLNGEVIITPDDMNQEVSEVSREVYLNTENLLVVELTSAPESFIDISVKQEVFADAERVIGLDGGVLEVTEPGSPLYGVSLDVPSGALTEPVPMTITLVETSPVTPEGIALTGQTIDLQPEGLTFTTPVTLTLNYSDSNDDGILDGTVIDEDFVTAGYFNEFTQTWEPLEVIARDFQNNTVTVLTRHFSIYSSFARTDNLVPQTTQTLYNSVNGGITIDGDPSDWEGLNPTKVDPDPPNDSVCGLGSDIKHVYTAIDKVEGFAYLMIEMHDGPIKDFMTIQVNVDIRAGQELSYNAFAEYGMNFHGSDVPYPYMTSAWTTDFHMFDYSPNGYSEGAGSAQTARGAVLEAKIPLGLIKDRMELALNETVDVDYFNITNIDTHEISYVNKCDVDAMYPKINWFRMQKRLYEDKDDHVRFAMSQMTRLGEYLQEPTYIGGIEVVSPDNSTTTLGKDDLISIAELSAYGTYDQYHNTFHYGGYSSEFSFYKKYFAADEFTKFESQTGTYEITLTDLDNNIYETEYHVTRTADIPHVDSNTINCSIDSGQGLICNWTYPDFEAFEPGLEPQMNALPHFKAMQGEEILRILRVSLPFVEATGHLHNEIIIPSEVLTQLTEGADQLLFAVRARTRTDNVRSYSAEIPIDISGL